MLTVVFATKNRDRILQEVLKAYCDLTPPRSGWKLVVVDNGSTDQTMQVLESFVGRLPLKLLVERKVGKNYALNAGLEVIEGDLVVFTDDDTFPHSDWLAQIQSAADSHADYAMFGGVVRPRWEIPPPPWVDWANQAAVYTVTDPSLKEGVIDPREIYGPNMAVRSEIFKSGLRFDTSIGPSGSSYPMGSETELVLRLARQKHKAWHIENAVVEHFIRAEQLKKKWVWQRAIRFGRGQYRLYREDAGHELRKPIALALYFLRKMVKQAGLMALGWIYFQPETLFRAHWRFNTFRGQAMEARILMREENTPTPVVAGATRSDS